MNEFIFTERVPAAEEYQALREAVKWSSLDKEAVEVGLGHSLYSICVMLNGEVIGCGRIIGDGGVYFYLQDVIVLPPFQGQGVGREIMDRLFAYIETHAKKNAYIGLMAAPGVSGFYRKYGFEERGADRPGMFMVWEENKSDYQKRNTGRIFSDI